MMHQDKQRKMMKSRDMDRKLMKEHGDDMRGMAEEVMGGKMMARVHPPMLPDMKAMSEHMKKHDMYEDEED